MKKLFLLLVAIALISCNKEPKDYVSLKGKITNSDTEVLTILGKNFKKDITINEDGTFSDTLKVVDGFHGFNDGKQQSFIYLKNGYDLTLNFDTKEFPNSVEYKGEGSGTNQYLTKKLSFIKDEDLNNVKALFTLEKPQFDERIASISKKLDEMLTNADDLEPEVLKQEQDANKRMLEFFTTNYDKENAMVDAFKPGTPSPKFNYPDVNGKNVSLDDLKGKYVYVDVWATWCAPCKREIPHLKELNKTYKDKEIAIVSLSIDKMEHKEKWMTMVKDKNLTGIQIMGDKDWNSDFVRAYNIQGIPRFILIDKKGNIVSADAPRPSDPKLKELFNSLGI